MIVTPSYIRNRLNRFDSGSILRVPTQWDDEFNEFNLNPKWTVNFNNFSEVDYGKAVPSCIRGIATANQYFKIAQDFAQGGDFSVTLKGALYKTANYNQINMSAASTDYNEYIQMCYTYASGYGNGYALGQMNSRDGGTVTNDRKVLKTRNYPAFFLHLQRTGTNWIGAISTDGVSWFTTTEYSKSFTVSKFEVVLGQYSATVKSQYLLDWVRVNWITL